MPLCDYILKPIRYFTVRFRSNAATSLFNIHTIYILVHFFSSRKNKCAIKFGKIYFQSQSSRIYLCMCNIQNKRFNQTAKNNTFFTCQQNSFSLSSQTPT